METVGAKNYTAGRRQLGAVRRESRSCRRNKEKRQEDAHPVWASKPSVNYRRLETL